MFWLGMEGGRVAITLRPQLLECGGICHRLLYSFHMLVWNTGRIQTWYYLLGRTRTIEVCVLSVFFILVDNID
jgi:hypothetical protein